MDDTLRSPPEFLSALRTVLQRPDASAFVDALAVVLSERQLNAAAPPPPPPQAWELDEVISVLTDPDQPVDLFGALRLLHGVQSNKPMLGYGHHAQEDPIRIDQALLMEFAREEIVEVEPEAGVYKRPRVEQTAVGLLGPNGALPYAWTEFAHQLSFPPQGEPGDASFVAWINVLQRRHLGLLYRAWSDTQAVVGMDRPDRPHPLADRLRALAGLAYGSLHQRDGIAPGFKMAFAAVLSRRVRNPQPLAEMLVCHFDIPFRIEEFAARWLPIPANQRTSLGIRFSGLGQDAVLGDRVWDCTTRFRIVAGPMTLPRYRDFLPGGLAHTELIDLVTHYAGIEFDWELQLVLQHPEVPACILGTEAPRLGWTSWLGLRQNERDADDLRMSMLPKLGAAPTPQPFSID